jgi:RimJ/RimL family protein N-acetyltransferase
MMQTQHGDSERVCIEELRTFEHSIKLQNLDTFFVKACILKSLNEEEVVRYMALRLPYTEENMDFDFYSHDAQNTFVIFQQLSQPLVPTTKQLTKQPILQPTIYGFIQLSEYDSNQMRGAIHTNITSTSYTISLWIIRKFQGQGIAKAALRLFLQTFRQGEKIAIYAQICKENSKSIALFECAGFSKTPTQLNPIINDFGFHEQEEYVLVRN